jgi:RNA polymerase sigma-32 factor
MDNFRLVRIGTTQAQRKLFYNLKREQDDLAKRGLELLPETLAERLGVSEKDIEDMSVRLSTGRELSLDAPGDDNSGAPKVTLLQSEEDSADNILANAQIKALVDEHLKAYRETLNARETKLFDERILAEDPTTLQEFAEEFGVSRERIRQLEEKLKKGLARYLRKTVPELVEAIM